MKFELSVCMFVDESIEAFSDFPLKFSPGSIWSKSFGIDQLPSVINALDKIDEPYSVHAAVIISKLDFDELDYYVLSAKKIASLSIGAWEANSELIGNTKPVIAGGWAPIKVLTGMVYSTKLKKPRDIAYISEGANEFVVSNSILAQIKLITPELQGLRLFSGKRKDTCADGVSQLFVDVHAPPASVSKSVEALKGYGDKDVAGGTIQWLGLPAVPEDTLNQNHLIMRSSEPWDTGLQPGWIIKKECAEGYLSVSDMFLFFPVLTEGRRLWMEQEAFFGEVKRIIGGHRNASIGTINSQTELSQFIGRK